MSASTLACPEDCGGMGRALPWSESLLGGSGVHGWRWAVQPSRSCSNRCTGLGANCWPVSRWPTIPTRSRVQASPSNPWAIAPCSSARSIAGSWLSGIAGWRLGPRLRNAAVPPVRQRARHSVAVCLATPSRSATDDVGTPWANSSAARSRTACSLARCRAPSPCSRGGRRPAPFRCHVDSVFGSMAAGLARLVAGRGALDGVATELA